MGYMLKGGFMKFYAVVGHNGVVVTTCWKLAQLYRKQYLSYAHICSFSTYKDAESYALDEFYDELPIQYIWPERLELNKITFAESLWPD